MSLIEFERQAQVISKKDIDRMAGNLLGKIKSRFSELPSDFWSKDSQETLERNGKQIEARHINPDLEASTTTLKSCWKDGGKDHVAILEVMHEKPILSIAGRALWKLHDLSGFTFTVDGEVYSSTLDAKETSARAGLFIDSL